MFIKRIFYGIYAKLTPALRELILTIYYSIRHPKVILKNIKYTKSTLQEIKKNNPEKYSKSKKALWHYCFRQIDFGKCKEYLDTYKLGNVKCIQSYISKDLPYDQPILICVVKNDFLRIKEQVKHHKMMGINHFIYIDNMSDDGTFEWLVQQKLDVYRVDDEFSATAKNAWIRQVTDCYGYNRWYLILDSDELFVYPGMEKNSISLLISFAREKGMKLIQSFMIDMYSKEKINNEPTTGFNLIDYDIKRENCYFDSDSYFILPHYKGQRIHGGPRSRVFSDESKHFIPLLTKSPLIHLKSEYIYSVHFSMPFNINFNNPIISGILHYKFLPEDKKRYVQIAKDGNYAGGSAEYKQYLRVIKKNPELKFYNTKSSKFTNSMDLLKINIFNRKKTKEFLEYKSK